MSPLLNEIYVVMKSTTYDKNHHSVSKCWVVFYGWIDFMAYRNNIS
jgi:hypothetical protein